MSKEIGAKAQIPNPALKSLDPLIGEWQTSGEHPYFPDVNLRGRAVFEWIEGGAFLRILSEIDHPKFPDGVAIIGSDDSAKTYYQIYFDERGISRKYDVTITDNQIKWSRDDEHLSQRFTITIEKDRLVSIGEMSVDGGEWESDLSLVYKKL